MLIERNQRKDIEVTLVVDEGEMNEIYAQLEDGHIPLSVLGKHNAGKSTLINAMIGDRFDYNYIILLLLYFFMSSFTYADTHQCFLAL